MLIREAKESDVASSATIPDVSLFRLYALRAAYLLMAVGLGMYIWPVVIHHTNELAATEGVFDSAGWLVSVPQQCWGFDTHCKCCRYCCSSWSGRQYIS